MSNNTVDGVLKFHADKGGTNTEHRGALQWSSAAPLPLRSAGNRLDLRGDEIDDRLVLVCDFYSQFFKLWIPEEKAAFDQVRDRIIANWYVEVRRYDRWVDGVGPNGEPSLIVYLEWIQRYYHDKGSSY